jgi:hypothetical protein
MKRLVQGLAAAAALMVSSLALAQEPAPAATAKETGVVLVFDDSGSMDTKVGSDTRLSLAKRVTEKDFVAKLNLELSMGLIFLNKHDRDLPLAEGASWVVEPQGERAGSCQKNEIMERVATCAIAGGTPLTEALRHARSMFEKTRLTRKIIVIITDGEAADPSSFAAEIDATLQARYELYAIGFCLDGAGSAFRDKLNAGGATRFFDATGTAASLSQAFQSILTAGNLEARKD